MKGQPSVYAISAYVGGNGEGADKKTPCMHFCKCVQDLSIKIIDIFIKIGLQGS